MSRTKKINIVDAKELYTDLIKEHAQQILEYLKEGKHDDALFHAGQVGDYRDAIRQMDHLVNCFSEEM